MTKIKMIMSEVILKFERENQDGIVAVGSYLLDSAKRFGIAFEADCIQEEGIHYCSTIIANGSDKLSPLTTVETEHFAANGRRANERLACQAKIDSPGEVVIMTKETKEETADKATVEEQTEQYKKEFTELPLEKKISALMQLEAIALGETFSFIFNSPYMIFDKVMDVMAEFGLKKEENAKQRARPSEHKTADPQPDTHAKAGARKSSARKRAPRPKAAE